MSGQVESKLSELGLTLPQPAAPLAHYAMYNVVGNMVFVSGQLPMDSGDIKFTGKVGKDLTMEQGTEAAQLCALNLLAQLKEACGGNLDRVESIGRIGIFVNCTDDFTEQPTVANGVSDILNKAFGDKGRHARVTVGINSLPKGVAVEVEGSFFIR